MGVRSVIVPIIATDLGLVQSAPAYAGDQCGPVEIIDKRGIRRCAE